MTRSDTDKRHGPAACTRPNSHRLGCFAGRSPPGGGDGGGTDGRSVATTRPSGPDAACVTRHTHSLRPGRAPSSQSLSEDEEDE